MLGPIGVDLRSSRTSSRGFFCCLGCVECCFDGPGPDLSLYKAIAPGEMGGRWSALCCGTGKTV